jgi:ankyrin repeat protein
MKLKRVLILTLLLMMPSAIRAQDAAKQALNDKFWEATRVGDVAAVKAALDSGADVNAKFRYGATALFKAAERGHVEVVKLLLERGADVTVKDTFYGATAMTWALDNDRTEVIGLLLAKQPSEVDSVLGAGARGGNVALVRIALAQGGAKAETLTSALVAATEGEDKNAEIAEMLKKAGAVPPPEIDAATLQTYVGSYKSEQGTEIVVTLKDGKLFGTQTGQPPFAFTPVDKTTFRLAAFDGISFSFVVDGAKVTGFNVNQGPTKTLFKRVE